MGSPIYSRSKLYITFLLQMNKLSNNQTAQMAFMKTFEAFLLMTADYFSLPECSPSSYYKADNIQLDVIDVLNLLFRKSEVIDLQKYQLKLI
ncbi:hypothetical protein A3Q56_08086 [Intoshia linei]|uniref:Uncharacterized protein n=1 Tax=Intoshia linei TaxID=1819745 RepID=A0A177AQF9_9BILA|nr:hypothetical protein A3Q56_08086 [Intoshia linei]